MAFETYDVAFQTTDTFQTTLETFQRERPIHTDFYITQDLWIGHLPHGISTSLVMDACQSAGLNFRPIRQYGCHYAFVRKLSAVDYPSYQWDEDGFLGKALFLSRLIHPTTVAGQYSARLIFQDGELQTVVPGHTSGFGTQVWIVAHNWRDWLTESDAIKLRESLPIFVSALPQKRVRLARARIDHAFHSYYLDQRVISLVTAFESLLVVEERSVTSQFRTRILRLADSLGLVVFDADVKTIYNDRSKIVHGEGPKWTGVDENLIALYQSFETLLRAALLRASIDQTFAQCFANAQSIREAFGNPIKHPMWPSSPLLSD